VFKPLRSLAVVLVVVVGSVTIAAVPASAAIPPPNVDLIWMNRATDFCLGVRAGNVTDETPIIVWSCNGNSDQTWRAVSVGSLGQPPYTLRNGTNGSKCLSVAGRSKNDGAALVIRTCAFPPTDDQRWTFEHGFNSECTLFRNVNSKKVMGVLGASGAEGAPVVQWFKIDHHPDQEWCSRPAPIN
jgi:hypothetical protein